MRTFHQTPHGAQTLPSASLVRSTAPTAALDQETQHIRQGQPALERPAAGRSRRELPQIAAGAASGNPAHGVHDFSSIAVYPQGRAQLAQQLTVRPPGDRYEREADQMADQVMRKPAPTEAGTAPAWKSLSVADTTNASQQSQPAANAAPALAAAQGRGHSLPSAERSFFESRFGHDFSDVRIHTDAASADLARAVHAQAFTLGQHIVFGAGTYTHGTAHGRHLIAHELAHVVQQRSGAATGTIQRQVPAPAPAPVAQPKCRTPDTPVVESTGSERFLIVKVEPPCYACPNSAADSCPKLAQEIFPPVATGPVQFSWQVRFKVLSKGMEEVGEGSRKNRFVIQRMEKNFNFSVPPGTNYPYTPLYWEAFPLDDGDQTEVDYWQFDIPDLTAGTWEWKSTLYLIEQLPAGMQVGNVADAAGAPATTSEPKGLGRVYGTRRIAGRFDFTAADKWHSIQ